MFLKSFIAGSVLQIVSAPGQQYLRPQGPVVMQTVSQAGTVQNALNALGNQHQAGVPTSTAVTQQGMPSSLRNVSKHSITNIIN